MMKSLHPFLILALAATACGPVNRSLNSVHQPVVTHSDLALDLPTTGGGLAPGAAEQLDQWFGAIGLRYSDRVTIDDPSPYGAAERRALVAGVVARHGLQVQQAAPVTAGRIDADRLRVVVTRSTAAVEGCPDWRRKSHPDWAQSTMSNYGCAVNANLAAMVADPDDLVSGTPYRGDDGQTATKAIDMWRKAEPSGQGGTKEALSSTTMQNGSGGTNR